MVGRDGSQRKLEFFDKDGGGKSACGDTDQRGSGGPEVDGLAPVETDKIQLKMSVKPGLHGHAERSTSITTDGDVGLDLKVAQKGVSVAGGEEKKGRKFKRQKEG
jgi:hypothetical protein